MGRDLDFIGFWQAVSRRRRIVINLVLLSMIISCIFSFFILSPVYRASVSIVIGKEAAKFFYEDRYTSSDILMYQQLVKTYIEIAQSEKVYQKASEILADEGFKKTRSLKVDSRPNTQIIRITVDDPSPENAAAYVNVLAQSFIAVSREVLPASELKVLDEAKQPKAPISPNHKLNIAVGVMIGLMLSTGMVFLLEYMDQTIRTEQDVKRHLGLPVLMVAED